jgi:hypothetical protein
MPSPDWSIGCLKFNYLAIYIIPWGLSDIPEIMEDSPLASLFEFWRSGWKVDFMILLMV